MADLPGSDPVVCCLLLLPFLLSSSSMTQGRSHCLSFPPSVHPSLLAFIYSHHVVLFLGIGNSLILFKGR